MMNSDESLQNNDALESRMEQCENELNEAYEELIREQMPDDLMIEELVPGNRLARNVRMLMDSIRLTEECIDIRLKLGMDTTAPVRFLRDLLEVKNLYKDYF